MTRPVYVVRYPLTLYVIGSLILWLLRVALLTLVVLVALWALVLTASGLLLRAGWRRAAGRTPPPARAS